MPKADSEYKSVSLNSAARMDLTLTRQELLARGTAALPDDLAERAGDLSVSDMVRLGMQSLRDRLRMRAVRSGKSGKSGKAVQR